MTKYSVAQVKAMLAEEAGPAAVLVHVLPMESWESRRIPGSECACVYEMTFLETVRRLAPDVGQAVVVYGAGWPSLESAAAAEKLSEAGYTNVVDFSGGLAEWEAAGLPVEGHGRGPAVAVLDGRWVVEPESSMVRWTGRNLFNHHEGTVPVSGGGFMIREGAVREASFTLDLRKIACADIADAGANALLLKHLADKDFFETALYPEAVFKAEMARPIAGATLGMPNYEVEGEFTLRGVTQPLMMPVLMAVGDDGRLTAQAWLEIDRTRWGVNYGSGRLFAWLGKHVVNDLVGLQVKLSARKE